MKRSINLSRTRKPRDPIADMFAFLRNLGYTDQQIIQAFREYKAKNEPALDKKGRTT